jgi:hypothetical protein
MPAASEDALHRLCTEDISGPKYPRSYPHWKVDVQRKTGSSPEVPAGSVSANHETAAGNARYSSTMCSNPAKAGSPAPPADLAVTLRRVIDELAAASAAQTTSGQATSWQSVAASPEFTEQLARAWAIIAAADPELAERAARYGLSRDRDGVQPVS